MHNFVHLIFNFVLYECNKDASLFVGKIQLVKSEQVREWDLR